MVTYQNVNRPGLHPKGIRAAFCWSRNETRILTEAEVAALMACETDLRNYLILRLLYIAGLRVTELCTLKWSYTVPRGETGQITVQGKGGKGSHYFITRDALDTTATAESRCQG
jgi:integrase